MSRRPVDVDPARRAELAAARRGELDARLHRVRARIAAACVAAGRDAAGITLVAITKTRPASDVRLLYELGQCDFGENRDQEAAPKAAQCAGLPITWHFVGQLQTNKAASVARYANLIHSVDRLRLVRALGTAARRQDRLLTCLIQVDLGNADGERGGAPPAQVPALAEAVAAEPGLVLGGVMAVAPLGVPGRGRLRRARPRLGRGPRGPARRGHHFGGHERRPGRGRRGGRDTPENWYGVARRSEAPCHVMSLAWTSFTGSRQRGHGFAVEVAGGSGRSSSGLARGAAR